MYESIDHRPTYFAQRKKQGFTTVLGDRHHIFLTRGLPESKQDLRFATVFGDRQHIFLTRGLPESKQNLCLATVFGDRHHIFLTRGLPESKHTVLGGRRHVFDERVA